MNPPVFVMYSSLCNAQLYLYMLPYLYKKVNSDIGFFFQQIFINAFGCFAVGA